jgi:hypothetical protein
MAGFEPATSRSRSVCSTKLSHTQMGFLYLTAGNSLGSGKYPRGWYMDPLLAALFYLVSLVCLGLAASNKVTDRMLFLAAGLASYVLVHGAWDAFSAAINS